jgi:hypothetical protein
MNEQEKQAYREKLQRAQQPWQGGTFQHFTPEQEAEHLRQVRELQESKQAPF